MKAGISLHSTHHCPQNCHCPWVLTSECLSIAGAGVEELSRVGLGGPEEGAGDTEVQDGVSPLSRAEKASRPTSSSGMSSRVLVSAARRASFSLSIYSEESGGKGGHHCLGLSHLHGP